MGNIRHSIRLPDFYAIGAPRCGTTSIYEVLRRRLGIHVPVKEPRFWCDDLDSGSAADELFFTRSFEDYKALYSQARPDQTVGDMSTWYLFSENAVPRIMAAKPIARFIVGVRNPVDLMQSLHATRVAGLSEDILDFKAALAAEEDRVKGHRIPVDVRNRAGLFYRRVATLGVQLERLTAITPRDQVHVYAYEDFRDDPRTVVNGILRFLAQSPLGAEEQIPVVNRRLGVRRRPLRKLVLAPGRVLWAKRVVPGPIRGMVRNLANATTLGPSANAELSAPERAELLESFRADIHLVSELVGRDMWARWSNPSPKGPQISADAGL